MSISNGLLVRVLPQAGQSAITNEVNSSVFTGTGTPTLATVSGQPAWQVSSGTLLTSAITSKTITGSVTGGGWTIAARFRRRISGDNAFLRLFGIRDSASALSDAAGFTNMGDTSYRCQSGFLTLETVTDNKANDAIHTLVYKGEMSSANGSDAGKLWFNRVGRVGTTADVISGGSNYGTTVNNQAFINCQDNAAYDLLDFIVWNRELTDAEAATVADDIRGAFNTTQNPVSFSGAVNNQSATVGTAFNLNLSSFFTGNLTPFSYSLVAGSLTGTGLTLNTSTGVISGTPTSATTISGLQVGATDTGSNTAQTNTFSITVSATAQVPQGSFDVGVITVGQTTASVPYTYSASDQTSIQYRINGGIEQSAGPSPVQIIGLTAATAYTIQFRAVNATGNGAWSTGVQFTTNAASTASFNLVGLANNAGVIWSSTDSVIVDVYNQSTGALVVRKTGLTTDSDGNVTVADAAMAAASNYTAVITIGSARGVVSVTTS